MLIVSDIWGGNGAAAVRRWRHEDVCGVVDGGRRKGLECVQSVAESGRDSE